MPHLFLVLLVAAVICVPLAATADSRWPGHSCGKQAGKYAANSTYEANLRTLAATLPEIVATSPNLSDGSDAGDIPDQVSAYARCRGEDMTSSYCLTCVTDAFLDAQMLCPYHKVVQVNRGQCWLSYAEPDSLRVPDELAVYRDLETKYLKRHLSSAIAIQAVGVAWVFFLFLQKWHDRKRKSTM